MDHWYGEILTQDNLHQRGRLIISACPFCIQASKEVNHNLIYFPFSYATWNIELQKFGILSVMPSMVAKLSYAWNIVSVSSKCSSLWLLAFFAIVRSI